MRDIRLTDFGTKIHFKKLTAEELRQSGSFNLVDENGEFVAMVIVPASALKRKQFRNLADQGNLAVGRK